MHRHLAFAVAVAAVVGLAGCTGSSQSSSSSSSTTEGGSPAPAATGHTALPTTAKTPITFNFTDVAIATGSNTLRLSFDIANNSQDPLLCDASEFNVQLDDGTVIAADGSADNSCDPDSVDPKTSGKAVMYFDAPSSYTGNVTMFLVVDDVVIGQGTTTIKP